MAVFGESWLALALLAMLCFSVSATVLKVLVSDYGLDVLWKDFTRLSLSTPVQYALVIAFLSLFGFGAFMVALQEGKVALVNAVASLSTLAIAILSYVFLGDRFTLKEIAAMALALGSLLLLAL